MKSSRIWQVNQALRPAVVGFRWSLRPFLVGMLVLSGIELDTLKQRRNAVCVVLLKIYSVIVSACPFYCGIGFVYLTVASSMGDSTKLDESSEMMLSTLGMNNSTISMGAITFFIEGLNTFGLAAAIQILFLVQLRRSWPMVWQQLLDIERALHLEPKFYKQCRIKTIITMVIYLVVSERT